MAGVKREVSDGARSEETDVKPVAKLELPKKSEGKDDIVDQGARPREEIAKLKSAVESKDQELSDLRRSLEELK